MFGPGNQKNLIPTLSDLVLTSKRIVQGPPLKGLSLAPLLISNAGSVRPSSTDTFFFQRFSQSEITDLLGRTLFIRRPLKKINQRPKSYWYVFCSPNPLKF